MLQIAATVALASTRKNLFFFIADDLRPQLNKAYGQTQMITPNFDKFSEGEYTMSCRRSEGVKTSCTDQILSPHPPFSTQSRSCSTARTATWRSAPRPGTASCQGATQTRRAPGTSLTTSARLAHRMA